MPEIQDIDEFKEELISLGNEPEIRSQRGEELPDIKAPESSEADDLSELFEGSGEEELDELIPEESDEEPEAEDEFGIPEGLTDGLDEDLESVEDFDELEAGDELEDFDELEDEDELEDFDELEAEESASEDVDEIADFDSLDLSDEGFDSDEDVSGDDEVPDEDDFSLEDLSLGDIEDDDIEATEFSLGDLGEEFGIEDAEETDVGALEEIGTADSGEAGIGGFDEAFDDDNYAIPDDEYAEIKKSLGTLPRNLKILIEELIGEKNLSGDNLEKLLNAMTAGAGAKELGSIVSKITGKKVKIPLQYERRSAEEFEKEKSTFLYTFKKNFIPMFRTAAIAAVALGLLLFLGYKFVYTPLHAESLYKKGYEEIYLGNNEQANSYFDQAFSKLRKKPWFYRYAEAFAENKQYVQAEEKYEQLLAWYPEDKQGILDYARLEFKTLGKYPEAEALLKDYLFENQNDYEARLMLADTYMEWAREIDPSLYEDARFNYAKLLELYGGRDVLLFRMMRYFIRTDNYTEAMNIYEAFSNNPQVEIDPEIYAELAGYLLDKNQLEDVREILMTAKSINEKLPEIHYELARYFKIIDIQAEEEKALQAAIWYLENTSPLTRTRKGILIDSYNRYGMILYSKKLYLDAENYYQKAAENYEEALANGQIKPEAKYGQIYSNLGDLSYYIGGDYDSALMLYKKAELNEFSPLILKYKKGYIFYYNEDYRNALYEFYDTAGGFSEEGALLYSTANTLFNRSDYFLAEGYYTHLLDILNKEYSAISYLLIDEVPEHRALLENIMKVSNNLGVTKYRLYERNRDPEKNAEAMVLLTESTEYYDNLVRDPNELTQPETVNLSYLNSRAIFYPVPDYSLQIYQSIPKDLSSEVF